MTSLQQGFQSGLQIARDAWRERDDESDRELRTQMNRLKANDIIKGMEVDAEVQNFAKVSQYDAKDLDPNHPGYASQLMGIAKTRMRDLSPAAYEKARPMVAQFYDKFDARKQIEAEMDQRGVTTDYRARFGEDPTGISFPDAKFALGAKDVFNVDPVFAEKDGIRIFDRKATQDAVDVEQAMRAKSAGKLAGEAKLAQDKVGDPRLKGLAVDAAQTQVLAEGAKYQLEQNRKDSEAKSEMARKISGSDAMFADTFKNEFSGATFAAPKSQLDRQALLEYKVALPGEEMPMAGASPNYPEMRKLITAKVNADKVAFEKSMTEAKQKYEAAQIPKHVERFAEATSVSAEKARGYSSSFGGFLKVFNDPKASEALKLTAARNTLKLFNSAIVNSPDAVAAAEAENLGSELEFKKFNVEGFFDKSKKVTGQDFALFVKKMEVMKGIVDASAERSRVSGKLAVNMKEIPSESDVQVAMGEIPEFQDERQHALWKTTKSGDAYGGSIIIGGKRYKPTRTGTTGTPPTDPAPQGVPPATPRAALPTQEQRRAGQIEQVRKDIAELKSKVPPPGVYDGDGTRPALAALIKAQEDLLSRLLTK